MKCVLFVALIAAAYAVPIEYTSTTPVGDIKCSLCQEVIGLAEKKLQSNGTEEAIKTAIEDVCQVIESHLPVAKELCAAVEDNIDQIIQLLTSEMSPEEVCKLLNLCANENPVVVAPVTADHCALCETVVNMVEKRLQTNATEEEIEKLVGSACSLVEKYLPSAKAECDFVEANIPTIIGLITSDVNPKEVCSLIGQCSSAKAVTQTAPPTVVMPFDNCDTCKELVSLVEMEIEQNATIAELKQVISEACTFIEKYVPQISAECTMVEDNLQQIIDSIVNKVSPEEACTLLGMCSSSAVETILKVAKAKHMV